jgi:hypothetical protein
MVARAASNAALAVDAGNDSRTPKSRTPVDFDEQPGIAAPRTSGGPYATSISMQLIQKMVEIT